MDFSKQYRLITFYRCRKCGQIVKDIDKVINLAYLNAALERIKSHPLEYMECSCITEEDCVSGRTAMDFVYYLIKED